MQIPYSKILDFFGISNEKPSDTKRPDGFDPQTLGPKEVYVVWDSVVKAEIKEMNKRFSRTFIIIAVVIALLLVVMQEFGLIFVVASLIFFVLSLNRLPEHTIHVEVSSHGIKYGDTMYYWHELKQFFFKEVAGAEVMMVDTYTYLPGRLFFSFNESDKFKIKESLDKHINFVSVAPMSFLDKFFENIITL
ncbi:MAG: hypothetical protein UV03_C0006G0004 [candidate division WWE3 bacterium GW2011_GWE1_42_16]|nr:MAG: hypothetical protein UV03_C0006G0004 [candidate division WWE3 bacterium GW2011_GWE1_42_16]